jgi:LytS/YehU family sensor histidine kinase
MQIPYGAFIAIVILITVYVNRKLPKNFRTIVMCILVVPTILGFALVAWLPQHLKVGRLIGYYLTGASNAVFVLALSLVSGNVGGVTKKSFCSASIFLGVAVGNIVGPFMFKDSEAPKYPTGIIGCMVSRILEMVVIIILGIMFATANKRRDRKFVEGNQEYDPALTTGLEDVSDWENKAFRYVV